MKSLEIEVVNVLVNSVCDTLDSFSAYDVTCLLRKKLPGHNIYHEVVKTCVENYVKQNSMTYTDNGTYKIYSKASKPCCVQPVTKLSEKLGNKTQPKLDVTVYFPWLKPDQADKLAKELNSVNLVSQNGMARPNTVTGDVKTKTNFEVLPVGSEGRVSLLSKVQGRIKNPVYRIDGDRLVVLSGPRPGFSALKSRVRTNYVGKCKVYYHPDYVEVYPVN